nr:MgtC/SapB family protein [Eubacterium sp.]
MREFWLDLNELVKEWNTGSILARLVIAMFIGILIGLDRERKNRGAGIKTHVLVCVGAALTMLTGQYIINYFPGVSADIGRIGAQVVSGVGFLLRLWCQLPGNQHHLLPGLRFFLYLPK